MNIRIPITFIGLFLYQLSCAQSNLEVGSLPAINFNSDLSNGYKLNFKWESRQVVESQTETSTNRVSFVLSDFSGIVSKKVGLNSSIAGGYLIRFEGDAIAHRTIQQFTFVRRFTGFRLGQRFASDQTFGKEEDFSLRLRYRLTGEFPLSGQEVDNKEFYLKVNNEYLNAFESNSYDLEIRLVPSLGYLFTDKNKLEAGLDYRIDSFLNGTAVSNLWFAVSWYIKL